MVYEETDKAITDQKRVVVNGSNLYVDGNIVSTGENWVLRQQALSLQNVIVKIAQNGYETDEAIKIALAEYSDYWMTKNVLGFDIKQNF